MQTVALRRKCMHALPVTSRPGFQTSQLALIYLSQDPGGPLRLTCLTQFLHTQPSVLHPSGQTQAHPAHAVSCTSGSLWAFRELAP